MKALLFSITVLSTMPAWAQEGSAPAAASAQPASPDTAPPPPPPAAAPVAAPAANVADAAAEATACDAALANPPGGDKRFIDDVQFSARGWSSSEELAKSKEGRSCMAAIAGLPGSRDKYAAAADTALATERTETTRLEHERAAAAIAKNEKHVILAYAALWILSAGFLLFLWRRQQGLKAEIANLKRDLDAAAKE